LDTSTANKERPNDQRFQVRWPMHILAADGSRCGEKEDISLGGAFIRCKEPPPPDAKILLTFENHSSTMRYVLARVAWRNLESQGSSDKPIGMSIQFMHFLGTRQPREKNRVGLTE